MWRIREPRRGERRRTRLGARRRELVDQRRVWLDDLDLWWRRHHDAEPTCVERSDVVEVGAGERTVVVRTVDGVEHTVTDLGTPAERVALATAIRETLA